MWETSHTQHSRRRANLCPIATAFSFASSGKQRQIIAWIECVSASILQAPKLQVRKYRLWNWWNLTSKRTMGTQSIMHTVKKMSRLTSALIAFLHHSCSYGQSSTACLECSKLQAIAGELTMAIECERNGSWNGSFTGSCTTAWDMAIDRAPQESSKFSGFAKCEI